MSDRLQSTSIRTQAARAGLFVFALLSCGFADARDAGPLERPFPFDPLPPPLVVTGGFCEFRIGHFHAGLDLGTKQRVGMKVLAPMAGWVERVRSSGVGYGRSIYLHTDDGRLVQLGHLDAFVEPLASYVRAKQDSSGQYEQDLWPEKNQFRFRAGQQLAWSGESGAGGPHLHVEIRRGDMAYHPLRAGMTAADSAAPSIVDVTLEPLDEQSLVEGSAAPRTVRLGPKPDTVRAIGKLRAVVAARDGLWRGVDRMVPWSVGMEWEGRQVECRFDSVSWATDMVESDWVYDAGRVIGQKGIVLWAPAGFRPRVMRTSAPESEDAGTIEIRRSDRPRRLTLRARDLAGHATERAVVLAPWTGSAVADPPDRHREFAGAVVSPRDSATIEARSYRVRVPAGALFEPSRLQARGDEAASTPGTELKIAGPALRLDPAFLPLRRSIRIGYATTSSGVDRRTALYRLTDDGWDWIGGSYDSTLREFSASTRRLGRFALMTDAVAPRASLTRPRRRAPKTPYPTWGVEASVTENGSGLDARASRLVIDGKPVPTEWDSEERILRWRPKRSPRKGTHRVEVVATDRAGNVGRTSGTFVLD